VRKSIFAVLFLAICPLLFAQQALNNDAIIKLVKAGLSDDLIVSTINAQQGSYDTSTDGIIALKSAGVSDKVVSAIVTKSASQAPVLPPAAVAPESSAAGASYLAQAGTASGPASIQAGARVVIAPMGGFETYFAAAVREKKVPITLTLEKSSAQFFIVSTNTEWQGFVYGSGGSANWTRNSGSSAYGASASSTRGLEASIMLIDAKTKDVVWAYEVHKNSHGSIFFGTLGARGQQSIAEACAKHLKDFIEKGK
jgi:flagellar capping protein FliD